MYVFEEEGDGENSFTVTTPAIIHSADEDQASTWASKHIVDNPAHRWVIGKYAEADNPNRNMQLWEEAELRANKDTVKHTAMNVNHNKGMVIGNWVAGEVLMPLKEENPYMEVAGVFWKRLFPAIGLKIEEAFASSNLFLSMECTADTVTCAGTDLACGETFGYAGPQSETYCDHINERASARKFGGTKFHGGALIMPGTLPGWGGADVKELANLDTDKAQEMYDFFSSNMPNASTEDWEKMMSAVISGS